CRLTPCLRIPPAGPSRRPPFLIKSAPRSITATLSLHDALPISSFPVFWAGHPTSPPPLVHVLFRAGLCLRTFQIFPHGKHPVHPDRKSTRLNSSHVSISYAVFCLKKKNI